MKPSKYWIMFGGVIAFAVFGFLIDFIPFYTQNYEIELLGVWSLMALGALLGVALSLGTKRRTPEGLFLIGLLAFWFAYLVVFFAINYYHDYTHTIDFLSPWFEIGVMAAISAIGCMILGGRLNGWHGMVFLCIVGALSVGVGGFIRALDQISPNSILQTFYAGWRSGKAFLLIRPVSGALIWCVAWSFYPQARLELSDE